MSIHADENSNSESGDGVHLRMRKPQVETEKRPPSPTDVSSAEDDANVILFQQIALAKVRNQAQVFCLFNVSISFSIIIIYILAVEEEDG